MIIAMLLLGCTAEEPDKKNKDGDADPFADHALMADGFFNVAHRGGKALWPEHTLFAYGEALEVGADVIECDAHSSSDGVILCMHDSNLARTTDGEGLLKDHSFDELRALDAGYWFEDGPEFYPYRGVGFQIPTLEEALTEFGGAPVSIEIKQVSPSIAHEVADLVDQYDAWERTTLMSFFDTPIIEIREREPRALTALTALEGTDFLNADEDYEPPGRHLHAPMDFGGTVVSRDLVESAHAHGIKVWMWTINDPQDMAMLIDIGVDGIYTDDPILLEMVR